MMSQHRTGRRNFIAGTLGLGAGALGLSALRTADAEPHAGCTLGPNPHQALWRKPWSDDFPDVVTDLAAGKPLLSVVYVPLCSNAQVQCGPSHVGDPGLLATNLYWGGGFGVARHFDRPRSAWERLALSAPGGDVLEERVYRRRIPALHWRESFKRLAGCAQPPGELTQLVVLRAVHGSAIDEAVKRFWSLSTGGERITVPGEWIGAVGKTPSCPVHIAGYAGHNRLMDGLKLPKEPAGERGLPSFVLACYSDSYFSEALTAAGASPMVMTRALMAPEGYVVDAVVRGMGDNVSRPALRQRVVKSYAHWQRIEERRASLIFAR